MGRCSALHHQISARVRTAIESSGLSWVQVSHTTGIPRETLRRRLVDLSSFTVDELETVAVSLGLPFDAFVDPSHWAEVA
jgi:hypothetical protein